MFKKLLTLFFLFIFCFLLVYDFDRDSVTVAIIDTGISDDLVIPNNIIKGFDFVHFDKNPDDQVGHGSHIAGIISTIAPESDLLIIKNVDSNHDGRKITSAFGILYAIFKGSDIINLSYVSTYDPLAHLAIKYGQFKQVSFFAAAGNDGEDKVDFPANIKGVYSIGALTNHGRLLPTSNFNKKINFYANGENILSYGKDGELLYKSGTSMSTAEASAVAALLLSKNGIDRSNLITVIKDNTHRYKDRNVIYAEKFINVINENPYFKLTNIEQDNGHVSIHYDYFLYDNIKVKIDGIWRQATDNNINIGLKKGTHKIEFFHSDNKPIQTLYYIVDY